MTSISQHCDYTVFVFSAMPEVELLQEMHEEGMEYLNPSMFQAYVSKT